MTHELNARVNIYDSEDFNNMEEISFLNSESSFFEKITIKAKVDVQDLFNLVVGYANAGYEFNFLNNIFVVRDSNRFFVKVFHDSSASEPSSFENSQGGAGRYDIYIWSPDAELLARMKKELVDHLEKFKTYSIVWSFSTASGDISKKEIFIEDQPPLIKEFYPWLDTETVQDYFDAYLKSSETILLLIGVPGTGKTTFIRNLISENKLNADITYDDKLIKSDEFFLRFINDKDKDILIIEDADHLLFDREREENTLLNKVLNISDGLVKNISKKIVFSTNITDIEKIDPALIRPGRCYDVLDFRKLTRDEAQKVVDIKEINKTLDDRDYTLAELFSSNNRNQRFNNRRVGF